MSEPNVYKEQIERLLATLPKEAVEALRAQSPTEEEVAKEVVTQAITIINAWALVQRPIHTGADKGAQMVEYSRQLAMDTIRDLGGPNFALASVLLAVRLLTNEVGQEGALKIANAIDRLELESLPTEAKSS